MHFKNIIGNNKNKKVLLESITTENILHSYMFYGTDGIGKKMIALEFAKMILCNDNDNSPCEKCKSCVEFNSNNNPDFFFIEPDGNSIKIDQIRNMQKTILEKPIISSKKVYIINNADLMTKEAQNCLLKTLEEPQEYVVIILIASNENNILATVKSRCTKLFFENISDDDIQKYLKEKIGDVQFEKSMIKLSEGSIGRCIQIAQKKDVLYEFEDIIKNIENMDKLQILNCSKYFSDNKDDINLILNYMYILIFENIKNTSKKMNYINAMEKVQKAKEKLLRSNNFDMTIDNMLIEIWREINEKNYRG